MQLRFHHLSAPVLGMLGVGTAAHLLLGFGLGLSCDEAHYALYAAHLDWSYFDHPPLVGWVQWPLVALGMPDGILRFIPAAIWLVTAWMVHSIAVKLQGRHQAGFWAVLAFATAPVLHVLGIGLLPDTLLMLITAATLRLTLRMLQTPDEDLPNWWSWWCLGCLLGLAGLSKYTAVFLALPVVGCLLWRFGWALLRSPKPWAAVGLAVLMVLPVFVWNAQHDWASFAYQLHHGGGGQWQWSQWAGFMLGQVVMYPLMVCAFVGFMGFVFRGQTAQLPMAGVVCGFFGVPFVVLAYLSGGGTALPHWTAPAWVAWTPLAGVVLAQLWAADGGALGSTVVPRPSRIWLRRVRLWRWVVASAAALQIVLTLSLLVCMLIAGPTWLSSPPPSAQADGQELQEPINPFADFYGWDQAGQRAQTWAEELKVPHLAVQNWTLASRLAWYTRPLNVYVLAPGFDQFSIWSGELPVGSDAVLLDWSQMAYTLPVGSGQFARCKALEQLAVKPSGAQGRVVAHFTLYHCQQWGGQPKPRRWGEP